MDICWSKVLHVVLSEDTVSVQYDFDEAAGRFFEISDENSLITSCNYCTLKEREKSAFGIRCRNMWKKLVPKKTSCG
jgi:hypothetical protein